MKVLILLYFVYINYVICIHEKKYPKKVNIDRNLHIFNSKKLGLIKFSTKNQYENNRYTFYSHSAGNKQILINVPDSPYFPLTDNIEVGKPRVKKVLPEYITGLKRKKRSNKNIKDQADKKTVDEVTEDDKKEVEKTAKSSLVENKNADNTRAKNTTAISGGKHKAKSRRAKKLTKSGKKKTKLRKSKHKSAKRSRSLRKRRKQKKFKSKRSGLKSKANATKVGRRLIAAKDALIEDYPYMVSIQKGGQHWCSGALLNQRLVITTANCVWKSNKVSGMKVRIGAQHTDYGGKVVGIQEVMKHPLWNIRSNPDNDVALLLIDKSIRFSDKVHGVDLPNRVMMPAFNDAWVTSYGAERRDGIYSTERSLQVYHAKLMDRAECNNVTSRFGVTVSNNFICIAQTGRHAPCTRDTGAPAVSDGVVWGVASWGIRKLCGTKRFPAMFSYLASPSNMDFILNATRILMADKRHYPFLDRFPVLRSQTTKA